jgi:rRNA maturation protein Nop10
MAHEEIVHSTIELRLCPQARSNNATDSTCEVCGNMLMMPAPRKP